MRIAVLADTHDRYPPKLPAMMKNADEVWHLGDVCSPSILDEFSAPDRPLRVVLGNCDSQGTWPISLELECEGVKFFLTHIPPDRAPKGFQVVLHGHTHVPRDEMIGNVRWLCPGCITRPNRGAPAGFAWLTVEQGKIGWQRVLI